MSLIVLSRLITKRHVVLKTVISKEFTAYLTYTKVFSVIFFMKHSGRIKQYLLCQKWDYRVTLYSRRNWNDPCQVQMPPYDILLEILFAILKFYFFYIRLRLHSSFQSDIINLTALHFSRSVYLD